MTPSSDTPMRDGSRDGSLAAWSAAERCLQLVRAIARAPTNSSRSASVTSTSLPDLQRLRQDLQRRRAVVAQTVYECPSCGERLVGERRCPDCKLFQPRHRPGRSLPRMRHTPAAGRSARRGGGCASLSYPQRRANGRGHDALLAQSLDNPCGVSHMPTPGADDYGRRSPFLRIQLTPQTKSRGWPNGRGDRLA